MRIDIITGIVFMVIVLFGLLYPLIVTHMYTPQREAKFRSLVKTIYNSILENILVTSNTTTTLSINDTIIILKFRSSVVKMSSYGDDTIRVVLTPLASIPSDYMLFSEDDKKTLIVIGYFVEVYLPEKINYLELDGKISYISLVLENTSCNYLKASFLGSVIEFTLNNSLTNTLIIRLDESLMESYIDLSSVYFTGELSVELGSYTSIAYLHINTSNDTRIRVIRENIGGIEEVNINGSRLYEHYYVDPEYYESEKRFHIAIKGFGSGVRVDLNRVG